MHITSKIGLRKVKSGCAVLAILALSVSASWGQPLQPGPQVATFFSFVDDTDQPYGLYIPKNFDDQKKYPLVISLHGAFSNHRLNLKRVFGKFYRGANARQQGAKGTGIGLAMVKEIVEAHGGTVRVRSEPGQGSEFTMVLPCHES